MKLCENIGRNGGRSIDRLVDIQSFTSRAHLMTITNSISEYTRGHRKVDHLKQGANYRI